MSSCGCCDRRELEKGGLNVQKWWRCVPVITLVLLTGCGSNGRGNEAENLAVVIRGDYLAMERYAMNAEITADYGQRVYEFELAAAINGPEMTLTLTEPELAAGLTARGEEGKGYLEYDGVRVETGPLDPNGLSPMSALPALLGEARSGYMTQCVLETWGEETVLRVHCADPEQKPGTGRETVLWFDPDTHALLQGEISVDGVRVIRCICSDFTKG